MLYYMGNELDMFDILTAHGFMELTAPNKESLAQFLYLQEELERKNRLPYNIEFYNIYKSNFKKIQEYVNQRARPTERTDVDPNYVDITLKFDAGGFWTFDHESRWFFSMFKDGEWYNELMKQHPDHWDTINTLKHETFYADIDVTETINNYPIAGENRYFIKIHWDPNKQEQVLDLNFNEEPPEPTARELLDEFVYYPGEVWDIHLIRNDVHYLLYWLRRQETDDEWLIKVRDNISDNIEGFKQFIQNPKFDHTPLCRNVEDLLFDYLDIDSDTKF